MPELPDVEDYLAALRSRCLDAVLLGSRIRGISVLRTYDPPIEELAGRPVVELSRLGKRIVLTFGARVVGSAAAQGAPRDELFLVVHLMVAGRLRWAGPGAAVPARIGLAAFDFSLPSDDSTPGGTLLLTEAGTKRRASLHVVRDREALQAHDRGGLEPLDCDLAAFSAVLAQENRTLKRVLTDPRRLSGIGNAYGDEILHAAGLSPVARTRQLDDDEVARLYAATVEVLTTWVERLRAATGEGFPTKVTAFRPGFAVHGRFGRPCPVCGTEVQRIRYADNETNYCPRCQTGGRLLADRGLSRLLRDDWPRTIDAAEGQ